MKFHSLSVAELKEVEVSNQEGQLDRISDDLTDVTVELRRVSHRKKSVSHRKKSHDMDSLSNS